MSKESKGFREVRSESRNGSGSDAGAETRTEAKAGVREEGAENVFEGSAHVLRGLEQQLTYWEVLDGHEGAKKEMVGVLRVASRALREALKRAKAAEHEDH
jgi:hypothetical protein